MTFEERARLLLGPEAQEGVVRKVAEAFRSVRTTARRSSALGRPDSYENGLRDAAAEVRRVAASVAGTTGGDPALAILRAAAAVDRLVARRRLDGD